MKKLRLLLATLLAIVGVTRSMAQEAYAVYTSNNTTLTFYYDNQRSSRIGTTYDLNTGNSEPAWYYANYEYGIYGDVTNVVFDSSFADARPTSTSNWFLEMENLTAITGLEYLNTSEVTTMAGMFSLCSALSSLDVSHFDTGNVTDMTSMFENCSKLTSLDLSHFDTSKVTDMAFMFNHCSKLTTLDLASFNTANVTNMFSMFNTCSNLTTIIVGEGWNTEKVRTSNDMFIDCRNLKGGAGTAYTDENPVDKTYARIDGGTVSPGYLTSTVKPYAIYTSSNATLVFYYDDQVNNRTATYKWDFSTAGWKNNTSIKHVYFDSSFANYHSLTNLHALFYGCTGITDFNNLQNLNTENVTDMSMMFYGCKMETIDLSHFNTGKVETMDAMFFNCSALTSLNVNSFDTQSLKVMSEMFYNCSNLTTIYCDNDWNTSIVTNSRDMFRNCTKLPNFDETKIDATMANPTIGYFKAKEAYAVKYAGNLTFYYDNERVNRLGTKYDFPTNPNSMPAWASLNTAVTDITTVSFDESFDNYHGLTSAYGLFSWLKNLTTIENLQRLHTENVTNMSYMFHQCQNLQYLNMAHLNTSNVTNMSNMFYNCRSMSTIVFDVTNFDTGKVTNMESMFNQCVGLEGIDVNNFDVGNVTNMERMFYGCTNLETILCDNDWKATSQVTTSNSAYMFYDCTKLTSSSSGKSYIISDVTVDYANPTNGYFQSRTPYAVLYGSTLTFHYDQNMTVGDPNYFAIPWESTPGWAGNEAITTVNFAPSFDQYRGLTSTKRMFQNLSNLTKINNISRLHTEKVTDMNAMFDGCSSLATLDLSSLNTEKVTTMSTMFDGCNNLTTLNMSGWNTASVTNMLNMFRNCSSLATLDLSGWNTSSVTTMSGTFNGCSDLTSLNLSGWNTANVTNMLNMFSNCSSLTSLDLSSFNTANVTKMSYMFRGCSNLTTIYVGDEWSVASLTDSGNNMFLDCTSLVGGLGTTYDADHVNAEYARWDAGSIIPGYLSKATAYAVLSTDGRTLTLYYDKLKDTREGTKYSLVWTGTGYPGWVDVINGNRTITTVNIDESMAGYHGLTYAAYMFANVWYLSTINGLEYLNTENVTNMSYMFYNTRLTTLDLTHFDVGKVTNMNSMFLNCLSLKTIYCDKDWKSSTVTDSEGMFNYCSNLVGAISYNENKIDVNYANPANGYFTSSEAIPYAVLSTDGTTLTLYYDKLMETREGTKYPLVWDVVPGWVDIENGNRTITTVNIDESMASYHGLTNAAYMFANVWYLSAINGLEYLNTENVTNMRNMFYNTGLTTLDLTHFDVGKVTNMNSMFFNCLSLKTIYCNKNWNSSTVTDSKGMFKNCSNLVGAISYDENKVDVNYANPNDGYFTNLEAYAAYTADNTTLTFYYDNLRSTRGTTYDLNKGSKDPGWKSDGTNASVTNVVFDASFAGARPTSTSEWFFGMENLTTITGMEYLNTSEVTTMVDMFFECSSLTTLDLSSFNTQKVTDMRYMFIGCSSLTSLDLSNFNTEKVTNMKEMFYNCKKLTTLDLSSFNTEKVTNMAEMFIGCNALTSIDMSSFNTENVTTMERMFRSCESLTTLDLSSFNTAKVTNMKEMFLGCPALTTIYVGTGWNTDAVTTSDNMFKNCTNIRGGKGTEYDSNHVDATYARIDGGPESDTPGYFTAMSVGEPEIYAVLSTDGKTLSFYYDGMKSQRPGTKYIVPINNGAPDWYFDNACANIETAVFDESFAEVRPTSTYCWFKYMGSLATITGLEYLNTSEVTNMGQMFWGCGSLTSLDLSGFNTKNVTNMDAMFAYCGSLVTVEVSQMWSTANVTVSDIMFENCTSIRGGAGTTYDENHIDKEYARIDTAGTPGYFTYKASILLGDVNGDNKVDVADITALTNHLLGIGGSYNPDAADVDGSGTVTKADIPALVQLVLNQ